MRLERLEVFGFFNFPAPFTLDLRSLPAGLIAIVGPNGAGKTSLALDAALASVYGPGTRKAFPSRDGTLADYATSAAAYLDTLWSNPNVHVRVNVDGLKRKTEAVLEDIGGGPVNNGLVDTFRDAVDTRFPSLRSILASAYASQNKRGGFGELSQSDRIALFRELADLAHLEAKSQTAKRCAEIIEQRAGELRAALDVVRRDATPDVLTTLHDQIAAQTATVATSEAQLSRLRERINGLNTTRVRYAEDAERYAVASARVVELTTAVATAQAEIAAHDRRVTDLASAFDRAKTQIHERHATRVRGLNVRHDALVHTYATAAIDRQTRITNNRAVLADAQSIRDAEARVRQATADLPPLRQVLVDRRRAMDDAREQLQIGREKLAECTRAERDLASAQRRSAALTTVKFGAECAVDPVCPLVTDAVAAQHTMQDLETVIAHRPIFQREIDQWQSRLDEQITAIAEAERTIRTREHVIAEHGPKAALLPNLAHAEARIVELEADVLSAQQSQATALAALDHERQEIDSQRNVELGDAQHDFDRSTAQARTRAETLATALQTARERQTAARAESESTAGAKAALDRLDEEVRVALRDQSEVETALVRAQTEQAALKRQAVDIEQRLATAERTVQQLHRVEDEAMAWATLARACGKDGLQRLEIDAAGPIVSDLANQLLQVGYGPRFSIDIVTQVATAKGDDMKERFTILALDNAHGGEPRDIGDLSGGERVVVEEAVRAALSCYVNLRAQHRSETIWRDETLGALDPENAPKYVAMLRKMREISRAHQILYITHNLDAAALADAQIHVSNGIATVVLPPYSS